MNIIFYIIGICILITAFLNSSTVESAVHQIYVQLQYLTAIFLIGFGHLFTCINKKENTKTNNIEEKILPSKEEIKVSEKEQIENINKANQYKMY